MFKCPGSQFGNRGQSDVINDFEDQYRRMTTTDVLMKYLLFPIWPCLNIDEFADNLEKVVLSLIQIIFFPILIVMAILGLLFIAPI